MMLLVQCYFFLEMLNFQPEIKMSDTYANSYYHKTITKFKIFDFHGVLAMRSCRNIQSESYNFSLLSTHKLLQLIWLPTLGLVVLEALRCDILSKYDSKCGTLDKKYLLFVKFEKFLLLYHV
ncbi:hypothetical protein HMPREF3191_00159 [Veillonellaceae bacterium DNF00626]|nr:hypothetical protein HMPREF3191_00159 [Veillonellaceae bacterium DNF00626]